MKQKYRYNKDINVFLDLDNTMIYSVEVEKKHKPWYKNFKSHVMPGDYIIFERPGLQPFLDWLFKNFTVSIWTAASSDYATFIADNIIEKSNITEKNNNTKRTTRKPHRQLNYVLNSDNCEMAQKLYGKNSIKKLDMLWDNYDIDGYSPYDTLIIDDLGKVITANKHNSIRIKSFTANENTNKENELAEVKKKLIKIRNHYIKHINDKTFKLLAA